VLPTVGDDPLSFVFPCELTFRIPAFPTEPGPLSCSWMRALCRCLFDEGTASLSGEKEAKADSELSADTWLTQQRAREPSVPCTWWVRVACLEPRMQGWTPCVHCWPVLLLLLLCLSSCLCAPDDAGARGACEMCASCCELPGAKTCTCPPARGGAQAKGQSLAPRFWPSPSQIPRHSARAGRCSLSPPAEPLLARPRCARRGLAARPLPRRRLPR